MEDITPMKKVPYQKSPAILKTKRSLTSVIIFLICDVIGISIVSDILGVCVAIPVIGWIIAVIGIIAILSLIGATIGYLFRTAFSRAVLTETGIHGRTYEGKRFKLAFDNIVAVEEGDSFGVVIKTNIRTLLGGFREYEVHHVQNIKAFREEYYKLRGMEVPADEEDAAAAEK